jgi:hypothetical protein
MVSDGSQIIHLFARGKLSRTKTKNSGAVAGWWQGDAANQNLIECSTDRCFIVSTVVTVNFRMSGVQYQC